MSASAAFALPLEPVTEQASGVPIDVVRGLELLARLRPLWPIGAEEWSRAVAIVRAFAERWDTLARAVGWESLELYGLPQRPSFANLSGMGAAWVLARTGHRAVGVDARAITVASRGGNRLQIYRTIPLPPETTLPWHGREYADRRQQ